MYQKVGCVYTRYKNKGWGRVKAIILLMSVTRKIVETVIQVRTKQVLAPHAVGKEVVVLAEKIVGRS